MPEDTTDVCPHCGDPYDEAAAPDEDADAEEEGYDRLCKIGTSKLSFAGWRFYHGVGN